MLPSFIKPQNFDVKKMDGRDRALWAVIFYYLILRFIFAFFNFRRWSFRHWLSLLLDPLSTMAWLFFYSHGWWNPLSGNDPKFGLPSCAAKDKLPCPLERLIGHCFIAWAVYMSLRALSDWIDDAGKQKKERERKEMVQLKKAD